MVGIPGIGFSTGPAIVTDPRARKSSAQNSSAPAPEDGLQLSPEGERASTVANFLSQSEAQDKFRAEQVAMAKQRIEEGSHRLQQVVYIVAARISKYLTGNPVGSI
jgi:hypothetical protein